MNGSSRPTDYDPIADFYDDTRGGEDRGRRLARELAPFLTRGAPVLDVGAGTGIVARGLVNVGYRVIGVDLSRRMLVHALPRLGGQVLRADARAFPFANASFQQAYSVWVLHHVGGIPAVLRDIARVLRPGGRYLVVPQGAECLGEPDPANELARHLARRLRGPEADRWRGNAQDLPDLAPGAGLRVAAVEPLQPYSYEESPERLARAIESRAYSYLTDVSPSLWEREVEPTIAAIRALPNPDRLVKRWVRTAPMVILERP